MKNIILTLISIFLISIPSFSQTPTTACNKTPYVISIKNQPVGYGDVVRSVGEYECIKIDMDIMENGYYSLYEDEGWVNSTLLNIEDPNHPLLEEPNNPLLPPNCSFCSVNKDKFTSDITIETPYNSFIGLTKYIEPNHKNRIYLSLSSFSSYLTINIDKIEIVMLFDDGTAYTFYNTMDVNVGPNNLWRYWVFHDLTPNEIEIFTSKKITDYKIYVFETSLSSEHSTTFQKSIICLSHNIN